MASLRRSLLTCVLLLLGFSEALAQPGPLESPTVEPDKPEKQQNKKAKKAKKAKVKVSGFLLALYKFRIEQNDDRIKDPDHFRLGKAVVRFKGRVTDHVGYTLEIDPRSPTLEGVMRDGYVSLHKLIPKHEIRLGQFKVPWGYENWTSSTQLYFFTRSDLSEGIGRGLTHRDIGVAVVGHADLNDDLRIEDAVALVNGAGFGVQADTTQLKNVWGRVGIRSNTHGLLIHAGLSFAYGDQLEPEDPGPPVVPAVRFKFKRIGADLEIDHRYLFLGAEYGTSSDEVPADSGMSERSSSWFVTVAGKTPWHVGPALRYDAGDAEEWQRFTIGGYYGEPGERFRLLAHYEYFRDAEGAHDGRVTTEAIVVF